MSEAKLREYLGYATALLASMTDSASRETDAPWRFISYRTYMRKYNTLVNLVSQVVPLEPILDSYNLDAVQSEYQTAGVQQQTYFESVYTNVGILKSFLETKLDLRQDDIRNLVNFIQSNLRKAIFGPPENEVVVQNTIEQLLIGKGLSKGVDYDRETGRVKVSIKESIPDFVFQKLDLALEVKLSKDPTKAKTIVDEINADIRSYSTQYANIIFVVYDLGSIRDENEYKLGLENARSIFVVVVKH